MSDTPKTPTSLEFATRIKEWWEKNKFATTGACGGHNVFDFEPEFVTMAKGILGDWEAPFVVEVYRSKSAYRYKRAEAPPQRCWSLEEAKAHAAGTQFDDAYEVVVRHFEWPNDPEGVIEYKRFQKEEVGPGTGSPDDEGWFDVIAYSTKERWDSPSSDGGLDGFMSLEDAQAYADSEEFANFYQVVVNAYGEHENYEPCETVYTRFKREDSDVV